MAENLLNSCDFKPDSVLAWFYNSLCRIRRSWEGSHPPQSRHLSHRIRVPMGYRTAGESSQHLLPRANSLYSRRGLLHQVWPYLTSGSERELPCPSSLEERQLITWWLQGNWRGQLRGLLISLQSGKIAAQKEAHVFCSWSESLFVYENEP